MIKYSTTTITGGLIAVVEWRDGCQHIVRTFPASPQNDDRARALAVDLNRKAGCYG